jgi:hypothetical protein
MFGLIKGCSCHFTPAEKQAWIGHVCGLCLTLRDRQGQVARLATNYDAALLSVLCEAQSAAPLTTYHHVCPLRGFRPAEVVASTNTGSQFAAAIAGLMAGTKVADHLADGETALRYLPGAAGAVGRRWLSAGRQAAAKLGFAAERIEGQTGRQAAVEQEAGHPFLYYAQPTELAVAAAFSHTAVIAGCPENADPLYQVGRMFGRIMFLLDSYKDSAADHAAGRFNALAEAFAPADVPRHARRLFRQAHASLTRHFDRLTLPNPNLARTLLIHQLKREGWHTLTAESPQSEQKPSHSCWGQCFTECACRSCCESCCCPADCCDCCDCNECVSGCCSDACDAINCCDCSGCCDCGSCCDCGNCCDCNCS